MTTSPAIDATRPIAMGRSWHDEEEIAAVAAVLRSGVLTSGRRGRELEAAVANFVGARYGVAVSSGTAALGVALRALGVGPGDEVIVPTFTYIATATAVVDCGATPVLVDVDEPVPLLDPAAFEAAITGRTVAVVPVHLYGYPADTVAIDAVARRHGLAVVHDAAQAFGATDVGRTVGEWGTACLSFHASKHVSTGEGGMVLSADPGTAERARLLRDHGASGRYLHTVLGTNHRLPETSAAIGLVQLSRQAEWLDRRRTIASWLQAALGDLAVPVRPRAGPSWASFPLRVGPRRDHVLDGLVAAGIDARAYYPRTLHDQPALQGVARRTDAPRAEKAAREFLCLPCHPHLSEGDLARMATLVLALTGSAAS